MTAYGESDKLHSRFMKVTVAIALLVGLGVAAEAQQQSWWASDLNGSDSVAGVQEGRESSFDDYATHGSTSDLLWVELTFHSDKTHRNRNYLVEGWWGVGQEGVDGRKRVRLKFAEDGPLRTHGNGVGDVNVCVLAQEQGKVSKGNGRRLDGCLSDACRLGIAESSSLPVYFDQNFADFRPVVAITSNLVGDKSGTFGEFRFPVFVDLEDRIHIAQDSPSLTLNNLGILRDRAWMTRFDGGDPVLKVVFDLGPLIRYQEWTNASHPAQKVSATNGNLVGRSLPGIASEGLVDCASIGSHHDAVFSH